MQATSDGHLGGSQTGHGLQGQVVVVPVRRVQHRIVILVNHHEIVKEMKSDLVEN